jgi:hypothetical protein
MLELGVQIEETQIGWTRVKMTEEIAPRVAELDENWVIVALDEGEDNLFKIYLPLILNQTEGVVVAGTETYIPGQTYWGKNRYIEYQAGNLPIILGAPHAGYLTPKEIPNRTWGTFGGDTGSQEYTRLVAKYLHQATCRYPHMIINRLHRSKIDLNRSNKEGAQGNALAGRAWEDFHMFIERAEAQVGKEYGKRHYFDLHTQAHPGKWVELGYLLSPNVLNLSNSQLAEYINRSSIRQLGKTADASFGQLVRGQTSLGGFLQSRGYKSVPSPAYPSPGGKSYFNGGYNILQHGSKNEGNINATQIETYWELRTDSKIDGYSKALANSILDFYRVHYKLDLRKKTCN